jgi:hypothetical protein
LATVPPRKTTTEEEEEEADRVELAARATAGVIARSNPVRKSAAIVLQIAELCLKLESVYSRRRVLEIRSLVTGE